MKLDTYLRSSIADQVLECLQIAYPLSRAELRGSLRDGSADAYSDIDIFWEVPDEIFMEASNNLPDILSEVRGIRSFRSDPDFQNSEKRRLIFVQFKDLPLFWRVDIEIFAESIQGDREYDLDNKAARGDDWSFTYSALMNAIAAIKAIHRDKENVARGLLERAYERVSLETPESQPFEMILALTQRISSMEQESSDLANEIERVVYDLWENRAG